jgi:peptidylprolyl isomerase
MDHRRIIPMATVKKGDIVRVHYEGRLADGRVFDSTKEREPVQVQLGEAKLPAALEEALLGMRPGEHKTVSVPSKRHPDPQRKTEVLTVPRDDLTEESHLEVGQQMELRQANGTATIYQVTDMSDQDVTLQAYHYLLTQNLTLAIELIEIV